MSFSGAGFGGWGPNHNLLVGAAIAGSNADGVIALPSGSAPTSSPSGVLQLYANTTPGITLTPQMTSNTAPSGVVSSSSYNTWPDYAAFNDSSAYGWLATISSTQWLQYQFPSSKIVSQYGIVGWSNSQPTYAPANWTLQGSNDGSTWNTLDTQVGVSGWTDNVEKFFTITGAMKIPFLYFKLNITASNGATGVGVKRLHLQAQSLAVFVRNEQGGVTTLVGA